MNIGIFGGTFDPFTLAHREIVKQAIDQQLVDKIIIAPTIVDWHRSGKTSWLSDSQKIAAIEKLLEPNDVIKKVDIYTRDLTRRKICCGKPGLEDKIVKPHRFIDTLVDIMADYSGENVDFSIIMGNDSWSQFETWSNYKDVASLVKKIYVANGREESPAFEPKSSIDNATWFSIDGRFASMSASRIRAEFSSYDNYIAYALSKLKTKETLLHTPIFDVVRGEQTSTGLKPVLVNAPDWVTIVAESKGKFLVEKQWRYGSASMVEEFPCGMVEKGEDPLDAAVRELEEETGFKIIDKNAIVKIGQVNPNPAFMTNTMHYFYVDLNKAKYTKTTQKLDTHESIKFFFKDMDGFCHAVFDKALDTKSNIPALLATALALVGFYKMKIGDEDDKHT